MSRTVDVDLVQARGFSMLIELLRAMRPKEWIKNTFVFAAICILATAIVDAGRCSADSYRCVHSVLYGCQRHLPAQRSG